MGGRSVFAISEAAQSLSALMWINQARFGFECGVSNRNCRSVGIACDSHLGVKLLRKRLHKTGAQPAFFLTCVQIRHSGPIIGNRQLPVSFCDFV